MCDVIFTVLPLILFIYACEAKFIIFHIFAWTNIIKAMRTKLSLRSRHFFPFVHLPQSTI